WNAAFPVIEKFVSDGLPRITEFATEVQNIFLDMFAFIKEIFDDIWRGVVDPAMQLVSRIIRDALDLIFDWWDTWGTRIVANIRETLKRLRDLWNNLFHR